MKTEDFPKLKLYVSIPGDMSVGIFPGEAVVTIQDCYDYSGEEKMNDLKEMVAAMYDVSPTQVRTEVEEWRGRIKYHNMELNMLIGQIEDLDISDSEQLRQMNEYRRIAERQKKSLLKKLRSLKKYYEQNKFFYKKFAKKK